jgi:hypothetical protein
MELRVIIRWLSIDKEKHEHIHDVDDHELQHGYREEDGQAHTVHHGHVDDVI